MSYSKDPAVSTLHMKVGVVEGPLNFFFTCESCTAYIFSHNSTKKVRKTPDHSLHVLALKVISSAEQNRAGLQD